MNGFFVGIATRSDIVICIVISFNLDAVKIIKIIFVIQVPHVVIGSTIAPAIDGITFVLVRITNGNSIIICSSSSAIIIICSSSSAVVVRLVVIIIVELFVVFVIVIIIVVFFAIIFTVLIIVIFVVFQSASISTSTAKGTHFSSLVNGVFQHHFDIIDNSNCILDIVVTTTILFV